MREAYRRQLARAVEGRRAFAAIFLVCCAVSLVLVRWVGEDFFPSEAAFGEPMPKLIIVRPASFVEACIGRLSP